MDGRPVPVLDNEAGIKKSCRNSDRIAFIELDAPIIRIRLSDCLHRNVRGSAPAAPVEGAGSAPPLDLLKQWSAERTQVGVARLDEPLAKHALQRDSIRFADGCRLDATWRAADAGHDKPPRKRLALAEYTVILRVARVDERAKFFLSLAFIAPRTSEYLLFTWRRAAARYRWHSTTAKQPWHAYRVPCTLAANWILSRAPRRLSAHVNYPIQ